MKPEQQLPLSSLQILRLPWLSSWLICLLLLSPLLMLPGSGRGTPRLCGTLQGRGKAVMSLCFYSVLFISHRFGNRDRQLTWDTDNADLYVDTYWRCGSIVFPFEYFPSEYWRHQSFHKTYLPSNSRFSSKSVKVLKLYSCTWNVTVGSLCNFKTCLSHVWIHLAWSCCICLTSRFVLWLQAPSTQGTSIYVCTTAGKCLEVT